MEAFDKNDPQSSFGAFKPVGNIVIVFGDAISAINAQTDLLAGGHDSMEVTYMDADAFVKILDEMRENQGVLAVLGSELKKSDQFRKYAERGASFVVAYAPSEDETKNVMNVVERYNYLFALKYGHLIIERFDPSHPA